jgi:transcriptional regulator with XRE-family HTH domain
MTQSELARRSSISLAYVSLIEQNKRDPTTSVSEAIARGLDMPLSILVFLASDKRELVGLSDEIREKLSRAALDLLKEPGSGFLV